MASGPLLDFGGRGSLFLCIFVISGANLDRVSSQRSGLSISWFLGSGPRGPTNGQSDTELWAGAPSAMGGGGALESNKPEPRMLFLATAEWQTTLPQKSLINILLFCSYTRWKIKLSSNFPGIRDHMIVLMPKNNYFTFKSYVLTHCIINTSKLSEILVIVARDMESQCRLYILDSHPPPREENPTDKIFSRNRKKVKTREAA